MEPLIQTEIDRHYTALYAESARLSGEALSQIELIRTQEIIERYLPATPADILDIGGGPGVYSGWLSEMGHRPSLIDPCLLYTSDAADDRPRV